VISRIDGARVVVLDGERLGRIDPPAIRLLIGLADTVASADRVVVTAGFPVSTEGPVDLGGITAADVDDALEWWEESVLTKTLTTRTDELPLASQELLRGVTPEQLAAIEHAVVVTELDAGEYLAREGDDSDCVYFLLSGLISVRLQVEGRPAGRRVAGFGAGVSVGELALLDESPRSADLVVERSATVASLSVRDLDDLDVELPGLKATIYANLAHSLSERLRSANGRIRALEQ